MAVEVVVGLLAAAVVVAGVLAAVEVVAVVVVAVEPLVEELPLLPQAAMSAEHTSARTSTAGRLPIIDSPFVGESGGLWLLSRSANALGVKSIRAHGYGVKSVPA
ncbi:MAG TPA: hypothetical protein VIH71_00395 [Solirubrobacteraceae bacterium]